MDRGVVSVREMRTACRVSLTHPCGLKRRHRISPNDLEEQARVEDMGVGRAEVHRITDHGDQRGSNDEQAAMTEVVARPAGCEGNKGRADVWRDRVELDLRALVAQSADDGGSEVREAVQSG
jgi:hypothetical protein